MLFAEGRLPLGRVHDADCRPTPGLACAASCHAMTRPLTISFDLNCYGKNPFMSHTIKLLGLHFGKPSVSV